MRSANTAPSKGEPAGPSTKARQSFKLSGEGNTCTPSPLCIHTESLPAATSRNSFITRFATAPPPVAASAAAESRTSEAASTNVTFCTAEASTIERWTAAPCVMLRSSSMWRATSGRGSKGGFSAPPRRARRETTLSASRSSKPSPRSLICQHSPPVALTMRLKFASGWSPTMMASTTAPMPLTARSAASGASPALFWPSVSTSTRRSMRGSSRNRGSNMAAASTMEE
mmetsp:Transcript_31459/g.92003  ORF Transcript_31459/g.92003 Transcript_31459/m.92003 type:complete len:228 (-) Transcript_31459:471-1154(-)